MSDPEVTATGRNGVKTTAIRFSPERHSRLSVIAQLRGRSLQD